MHPYFTGLPILIIINFKERVDIIKGFNPYFIGLPILIFRKGFFDDPEKESFNPYFIGLPILIEYLYRGYKKFNLPVSILILLDYLFL